MNSLQRVIKYCAIGLAIVLMIGIISFIVNIVFGIVGVASGGFISRGFNHSENIKTIDYSNTFTDVKSLDINNATGELKVKIGDTFKVEAENVFEGFKAEVENNGKLTITDNESGFRFFGINFHGFNSPNSKITVYLPENFVAEEAIINSGAGSVSINDLHTDYLYISAGAGSVNGDNITSEKVKVEGGVGSVNLNGVDFNDANFNSGVGSLNITGILTGNNKVDCGVGSVSMNLIGNVDDYDLDIDSGVGKIRVNGEKVGENGRRNPSAPNSISINGGVGNVNIDIGQ